MKETNLHNNFKRSVHYSGKNCVINVSPVTRTYDLTSLSVTDVIVKAALYYFINYISSVISGKYCNFIGLQECDLSINCTLREL